MLHGSKKPRPGYTNSRPNPTLITNSQDTFSSNSTLPAIFPVITVPVKKPKIIWSGPSSPESLMKREIMELVLSLSISLENLSFVLSSLAPLNTLKSQIRRIRCSLRLMEQCSKKVETLKNCLEAEWMLSFGAGEKKPSFIKKRKKILKNGENSG